MVLYFLFFSNTDVDLAVHNVLVQHVQIKRRFNGWLVMLKYINVKHVIIQHVFHGTTIHVNYLIQILDDVVSLQIVLHFVFVQWGTMQDM